MRNISKITVIIILALTQSRFSFAQNENLPHWNGYLQTRFASDFDKTNEFFIRRAKIWIYGDVPLANYISYKFQMNYRSFKEESLIMQDAYADFQIKNYGRIRAGRFVPDFMLQRMQPDYEIPVLERALVVNSFIHNEKQMAREMGVSYIFQNDSLPLHFSLGVFNANVDRPAHGKDQFLLYTSRVNYKVFRQKKNWLSIGGSASYRHLVKSTLAMIYKPDSILSGDDVRWGIEAQFHWKNFELQGEYLEADINHDKAMGYYVTADFSFLKKYQAVLLTEKYNDLNPTTNDNEWYGLGVNYQITGKTKIMADFKAQESGEFYQYLGEIQLQIFFN